MKRIPSENKSVKNNTTTKKRRLSKKSLKMRNFFAIHTQLQQVCHQLKTDSGILEQISSDIKNSITTKKFFSEKEWWYHIKEWQLDSRPYSIAHNPRNNDIAIGCSNGTIDVTDLQTSNIILSFSVGAPVYSLAYSHDGKQLAYGLPDGTITIIQSNNPDTVLFSHNIKNDVWSLSFSHDNTHLAAGLDKSPNKKNIQIIDLSTKAIIKTLQSYHPAYGIFFHPQKHLITYATPLSQIKTVNFQSKKRRKTNILFENKSSTLTALSYNNLCRKIAFGLINGDTIIINPVTKQELISFNLTNPVYCLSFDISGQSLAIGTTENNTLFFFQQYTNPTPQQLMLRRILHLWVQVEKPCKTITSSPMLLDTIINLFNLNREEITTTWNTFPPLLQTAIWSNMHRLIQKHGK